MTTLREAAQMALDALDAALSDDQPYIERCKQTITALRAALAEPKPRNQCGETCERAKLCATCARGIDEAEHYCDTHCTWLDHDQKCALADQEPVAAQHRFRHPQKNMPDWSAWQPCSIADRPDWEIDSQGYEVEYRALYTAPQPAKQPLTDEQIGHALTKAYPDDTESDGSWKLANYERDIARIIEAAHGIGETK